jgi:hypothetical protein
VGKLLGFDFAVEYKLGATNTVTDALSCRDMEDGALLAILGPRFDFIERLRQAQASDLALVAFWDEIAAGQHAVSSSVIDDMVAYVSRLYIASMSPLLTVHDDGHEGVQRTLHGCARTFTPLTFAAQCRTASASMPLVSATSRSTSTRRDCSCRLPTSVWADIGLDFSELCLVLGANR